MPCIRITNALISNVFPREFGHTNDTYKKTINSITDYLKKMERVPNFKNA